MGEKGARSGPAAAATAARLRDELSPLGDVTTKPMFGGHGIFCDGVMFALVDSDGGVFLRDQEADAPEGSVRHGRMPYWSVDDDVLGRSDALLARARRALEVARRA